MTYDQLIHAAKIRLTIAGFTLAILAALMATQAKAAIDPAGPSPLSIIAEYPYGDLYRAPLPKMRHKTRQRTEFAARGVSLRGVYGPLAAKAQEISAACGSRVVSAVRHTRVAGTRRMSLHASGHAVDMQGNPGCIYAHLRGWSGGYSTDYRRVRHVHISLGGREDGIRFAHRGGRTRIAWR